MPDWMKRALDPRSPMTKDNESVRTMSSEYKGKEILYPTIRMIDGKLKKLSPEEAKQYALVNKDYKEFVSPNQAEAWSKSFSNLIQSNREEDMNIPKARQTLRKAIPPGEDLVAMNGVEFNWLQANKPKWFGSGKKHKKSGLRSFFWGSSDNDPPSGITASNSETPKQFEIGGSGPLNVGGWLKERGIGNSDPGMNIQDMGENDGGGSGVPPVPNINNPLAGGSGHETRTPTGPGSVTNPNDPYGVQKAVATGAKDLINKEYEAPTLSPEERIAATSAETLQARQGVQDIQGTGQEAYKTAAGVGEDVSGYRPDKVGSQSFLGGTGLDKYQNPHTAEVIKRNTDSAMDAMEIRRGQLMAKENMASPSGRNDRAAIERGVMQAQGLKNLGDQTAALYGAGFDKAADMKKYDMDSATGADKFNVDAGLRGADTRLRGADSMIAGTDAGRDAAVTDIDLMSRVGAGVEGRDQNVIDETMGDFYEERDWGENKLASAANIAGTNPTGSTTTTTGAPQHKKRDKFGRIISGAAGGWLASGGNPWGAVAGGVGGMLS